MPGDLRDHAEPNPEFRLASDLGDGTEYRLSNYGTMEADEIPGEYPKYGTFAEVVEVETRTELWLECPTALAQELIDGGVNPGDTFEVHGATKEDGSWTFTVAIDG